MLEFTGHPVTREYYVNDRGGQIDYDVRDVLKRALTIYTIDACGVRLLE